jgi:DNA-binding NtrC family response regulator
VSKWRALVAEDSSYVLFSLEMLLEQSNIEIVGTAATVAALSKLALSIAADVAILDVNLNGELVFPAAELLIARGVPVVFTTGYAPEKLFPNHLLDLPVLQKPYDPDEFLRIVEEAILMAKAGKDDNSDADPG